jgi:predicted nuclease with TOPRIM domain
MTETQLCIQRINDDLADLKEHLTELLDEVDQETHGELQVIVREITSEILGRDVSPDEYRRYQIGLHVRMMLTQSQLIVNVLKTVHDLAQERKETK